MEEPELRDCTTKSVGSGSFTKRSNWFRRLAAFRRDLKVVVTYFHPSLGPALPNALSQFASVCLGLFEHFAADSSEHSASNPREIALKMANTNEISSFF